MLERSHGFRLVFLREQGQGQIFDTCRQLQSLLCVSDYVLSTRVMVACIICL
jgi:hypothetical protein